MARKTRKGSIIVISAPSGSGKTTLIRRLMASMPDLRFSVSCTTRSPRPGEEEGSDYFFVSRERFRRMIGRGEFAEWAKIYGDLYGTPRRELRAAQESGQDIVLDVDVQGHRQLKRRLGEAVSIFILPPSYRELARRLRERHKDSREAIERRLEVSRREIACWKEYDYLIVNDDLAAAASALGAIVTAARYRRESQGRRVQHISETFGG